jgi:hypothetical protein
MKVFGVNYNRITRRLVAAETQKKAAELCGLKLHHFREYASETGNVEEVELSMKEPYVVWSQAYSHGSPWIRVSPNAELNGAERRPGSAPGYAADSRASQPGNTSTAG